MSPAKLNTERGLVFRQLEAGTMRFRVLFCRGRTGNAQTTGRVHVQEVARLRRKRRAHTDSDALDGEPERAIATCMTFANSRRD